MKDEIITHRVASVPSLLFRLHVLYQPGGAPERASILRQLEGSPCGEHPQDCINALRKWRRYLERAADMGVAVPDASILLRGVKMIATKALEANQEVKFRVALVENDLQLQGRPTVEAVVRYYNTILAELQQVIPKTAATRTMTNPQDGAKVRAIGAAAGTGESSSPPSPKKPGSGAKPCKFFATDK